MLVFVPVNVYLQRLNNSVSDKRNVGKLCYEFDGAVGTRI